MPSNLVCIHVVIVLLVATPPGSMDKFVIRKATSQGTKRAIADSQDSSDSDSELQSPEKVVATESGRVRAYKDKLSYNASWKKKHSWMEYDSTQKGMVCTVCKAYGKVPVQTRGAWVTRPVNNWVKATDSIAGWVKTHWNILCASALKALTNCPMILWRQW